MLLFILSKSKYVEFQGIYLSCFHNMYISAHHSIMVKRIGCFSSFFYLFIYFFLFLLAFLGWVFKCLCKFYFRGKMVNIVFFLCNFSLSLKYLNILVKSLLTNTVPMSRNQYKCFLNKNISLRIFFFVENRH